jgi:hypothetical protein
MKTPLSTTASSAGRSLKTLTKSDFRTLGLAARGGALQFYDFIIFILTVGLTAGILLGSVVDIGITIMLPACGGRAHRLAHRISARRSFWYLRCLAPTMVLFEIVDGS